MESEDQNQVTSGSPALSYARAVIAEPRPSKTLANVALGLGLYAATGPLLFVIGWNLPHDLGSGCSIAGLGGIWVAPFGIIVSTVALVLRFRRPQRIAGGRRALAGLLMSLMGVGGFWLISWSYAKQYRPWGSLRQMELRSRLEELEAALATYAGEHEGDFPAELQVLVDLQLVEPYMLRLPYVDTLNALIDFHYVSGLDQPCPAEWVIVFADSRFYNNEGGGLLYVDGTVQLLDEPEFSERIERFVNGFEVERGHPPEIIQPH
jgi:hypothetical protein